MTAGRVMRVALAALLVVATGAGCATARQLLAAEEATTEALVARGFDQAEATISWESINGDSKVVVEVTYHNSIEATESESRRAEHAAEVVWDVAPIEVQEVVVQPMPARESEESYSYSRTTLAETFGPRDPALDEFTAEEIESEFTRYGFGILGVLALLGLAFVALVVFLLRRRGRRKRFAYGSPYGAPPGWSGDPGAPPPPGWLGPPGAPPGAPGWAGGPSGPGLGAPGAPPPVDPSNPWAPPPEE